MKNTPNAYNIHGTNTINANSIGNNTVQQKDINWSKRILGNEALTHINKNIIAQAFIPSVKPYVTPSIAGIDSNCTRSSSIFPMYEFCINRDNNE